MRIVPILAALVVTTGSVRVDGQRPAGSGSAPSGAATVEGDIYLMMQSGDTKPGAGRTVYLLRADRGLEDSLRAQCAATRRYLVSAGVAAAAVSRLMPIDPTQISAKLDTAIFDSVVHLSRRRDSILTAADTSRARYSRAILGLLRRSTADTAGSGLHAHFTFSDVAAGRYILWSEWTIMGDRYEWWAPVTVAAGAHLRRDLDNASEGNVLLSRCDVS